MESIQKERAAQNQREAEDTNDITWGLIGTLATVALCISRRTVLHWQPPTALLSLSLSLSLSKE
jgi:hypothetical protein